MSKPLRLGFAGTPEFAATILRGLLSTSHQIALVLTQPDRPTGRGRKLKPSPVKALALANDIEVRNPLTLKGASLASDALDLLIVAAYGLILPRSILDSPRLGCLNVHASLLPRWRGAAPVERAIMAGDRETGVCLMRMSEGLDTGPVYRCRHLEIGADETGGQLEARLAAAGSELLVDLLPQLEGLTPQPQSETGVTYAHKLTARDSQLDWQEDAVRIARRIRALADRQPVIAFGPAPQVSAAPVDPQEPPARIRLLEATAVGEDSEAPPGTLLRLAEGALEVACGRGLLRITMLQINRGKGVPMAAKSAANGYPDLFAIGLVLRPSIAADG